MKTQIPNINRVRSAWRRVKEDIKDAIIRDLKPLKDVKGVNPPQAGGHHGHDRRPLIR
jgi:hypothetical protein